MSLTAPALQFDAPAKARRSKLAVTTSVLAALGSLLAVASVVLGGDNDGVYVSVGIGLAVLGLALAVGLWFRSRLAYVGALVISALYAAVLVTVVVTDRDAWVLVDPWLALLLVLPVPATFRAFFRHRNA